MLIVLAEASPSSARCVWPERTEKFPPVDASRGTLRLVSAPLLCTCGRARGAPSVKAPAQRRCRAVCARWGVAALRAVRLAGTHPEAVARESERWHVQVGECVVVPHLRASTWRRR